MYLTVGEPGGGRSIANSYVDDGGELENKSISHKHQGWYKCQAFNVLGSISSPTFFYVKRKYTGPSFSISSLQTRPRSSSPQ